MTSRHRDASNTEHQVEQNNINALHTSKHDWLLHSFDGVETSHLKANSKADDNEGHHIHHPVNASLSVQLEENERATVKKNHHPALGYIFMTIAVMGITFIHLFGKLAYFYNPKLSNYDVALFIGIWVTVIFIPVAIYNKIEISVFKLERGGAIAMLASALLALSINIVMMKGIAMISLGKGTLIFWTNPIFVIFLAYIILSEKLELTNVLCAIGAFIGIYFLTLNMNDEGKSDSYMGIVLCMISALIQAGIQIAVRFCYLYNVHWLVRPVYVGIFHLILTVSMMIFFPGSLEPWNYSKGDILLLSMCGIGWVMIVSSINLAFKYETASRLTPLNYIENVFTLLADVIVFGYVFVATDYIGMAIISVWIVIPAAQKIIAENAKQEQ